MKNFRKAAFSTICMLMVAVLSLTGATYAWFSASTTADVTGMTMNVASADGGLQVSKDGTSWSSKVDFGANKENMLPVSTIDAENFFTANVNPDDDNQIKTTKDTNLANVWVETFKVKNTGYQTIRVGLGNTAENLIFTDITEGVKDSSQAARLAIFTKLSTATSWDLKYIYSAGENNTGIKGESTTYFNFRQNGEAAADATYVATVPMNKPAQSDCTFDLPGLTEDGAEQIVDVKIVVWLEGQDAQCVNQNAASAFSVDLDFIATVVE